MLDERRFHEIDVNFTTAQAFAGSMSPYSRQLVIDGCELLEEVRRLRSLAHEPAATDWQSVDSSTIAAVRYDGGLLVRFRSGDVYKFEHVSAETFAALLAAESKGRFFHSEIRALYPYRKLDPAEVPEG